MISCKSLFETMEKKETTGCKLVEMGFPELMCYPIRRGHGMSLDTLNALCETLDYGVTNIVECVKEDK